MDWQYVVVGILGLVLFCLVLAFEDARVEKLKQNGVRTQGIVIKNNFYLRRSPIFRPVIQFHTANGRTFELEERNRGSLIPKYSKGQAVLIAYNDQNPGSFIILNALS